MKRCKTGKPKVLVSVVLVLALLTLFGCGAASDSAVGFSAEQASAPSQSPVADATPENQPESQSENGQINQVASGAENASAVENSVESIYGTWYINHTNATIWFNELGYEYDTPSSDFTIKGFNLETLTADSTFDNRTYFVEDDIIEFDTYSGDLLSFSYQCYSDGSIVLTNTDSGSSIFLTREMGLTGETTTEAVDGHKYGHRMGNESWSTNYINYGSVIAQDGGIVYYTNPADNDYLYCCSEDGSNPQMMVPLHTEDVNIMDGWVYFTGYDESDRANTANVYKMKLDGTERRTLDNIRYAHALSVVDDSIYYTVLTTDGSVFCSCDLDGNNVKTIADLGAYGIGLLSCNVYGDYAYFAYSTDQGAIILYFTLMRISLSDGTIETMVPKMSSDKYVVDRDGIFASVQYNLYHYDLDGSNGVELVDCFTDYVIKTGGDVIYNSGTNTEMASLTDLRNPTVVIKYYTSKVCFTDKYLYYYSSGKINAVPYR